MRTGLRCLLLLWVEAHHDILPTEALTRQLGLQPSVLARRLHHLWPTPRSCRGIIELRLEILALAPQLVGEKRLLKHVGAVAAVEVAEHKRAVDDQLGRCRLHLAHKHLPEQRARARARALVKPSCFGVSPTGCSQPI